MNRSFWAMVTGREPADMRIDNVRIVDVFSGAFREGRVSVGQGRWLLPGFNEDDMLCAVRALERMDGALSWYPDSVFRPLLRRRSENS